MPRRISIPGNQVRSDPRVMSAVEAGEFCVFRIPIWFHTEGEIANQIARRSTRHWRPWGRKRTLRHAAQVSSKPTYPDIRSPMLGLYAEALISRLLATT